MSKFLNYFKNQSSILHMESKKILRIEGKDTVKFINNICTSNIITLDFYKPSLFLDAKGKILTKANIFKLKDDFLIEIEGCFSKEFVSDISKFAFKKDVKVHENTDIDVLLVQNSQLKLFDDIILSVNVNNNDFSNVLIKNSLKGKYLNQKDNMINERVELLKQEIMYGIPCHNSIHLKFPSFFNFDLMNYIDFKKGCYLGQELTQRTKFSNSTNKRLFVFEIKNDNTNASIYKDINKEIVINFKSKDSNIYNNKDKIVGTIVKEYNPIPFISAFIVKDYFNLKEGETFYIINDKNQKCLLEPVYKPNI